MTENKPLNSTHDINAFKRIFLFLNVNAFHLLRITTPNSTYQANYKSRGAAVLLLAGIEYYAGKYFFGLHDTYLLNILIFGLFGHTVIDLLFIKSIIVIAGNYNGYYYKWLFYPFILLSVFAIACVVISFYNQIGHLPADYNKHH